MSALHLSNDLLIRSLDDELVGSELVAVETHVAGCEACRTRQAELRRVSDGWDNFVQSAAAPVAPAEARLRLLARLQPANARSVPSRPILTLSRFGWVLAAAATLAIGVTYMPLLPQSQPAVVSAAQSQPGEAFDVDGETFLYLPYSNPDLPVGGSHVVQMQVPISSLADAGVFVEPLANRVSSPDRAVLADVLLGLDGQPLGVHVLTAD